MLFRLYRSQSPIRTIRFVEHPVNHNTKIVYPWNLRWWAYFLDFL